MYKVEGTELPCQLTHESSTLRRERLHLIFHSIFQDSGYVGLYIAGRGCANLL